MHGFYTPIFNVSSSIFSALAVIASNVHVFFLSKRREHCSYTYSNDDAFLLFLMACAG